jgi:hypothetical protein
MMFMLRWQLFAVSDVGIIVVACGRGGGIIRGMGAVLILCCGDGICVNELRTSVIRRLVVICSNSSWKVKCYCIFRKRVQKDIIKGI